ncbi:MAG: phosphate propanoyltransferase [Oscillospiraceae bacterium]|jgi:putative phosphotransacetylase|nr:phosphate propanoyltransferase [Oscillospiraceae bacterium]
MDIIVETSARHVHVTKETLEILFGAGYGLTKKKDLSQPGQFACEERVTVVGPKNKIENISILGPVRSVNQVELSATDARSIGVGAVVRESGDVSGTPGCVLTGPKGQVEISEGVIVAKRHVHLTPQTAEEWGIKNGQILSVKFNTDGRRAVLGDFVARVRGDFANAAHIDTDESNAVLCAPGTVGIIVKEAV